ncbi:MAG TPA: PAS domain-containing sensor histidine kinase [Puia sp.]|nr:PAS domain-containing sensor histidine kinase [Puia sp.]
MYNIQKLSQEKNNYSDLSTLRTVFDRITDAFVAFDNEWNYTYLNTKAAEIIGRRAEDIIGKNIWKEFPEKKEDIFYASFFTAMSEQRTLTQEGYCHPLRTWLHATLYPSSEGLSVYMQDITAKKKVESELEESREKYRQIVETAQEGIWMIDENNKTVFVNQKMCDILEYSADEMIGKENICFLDDIGRESSSASLARRRKGVAENIDKQFITKSGKLIWTNMSANPIYSKQGEYKGALAMISDISGKVKLQEQLINEQINKQREIVKAVMIAQEKERNHLGQELHDNVNQILAATKLHLTAARQKNASLKKYIEYPLELIDTAMEEIRSLCRMMVTPVKNIDLKKLIQRLIDDLGQNSGIKTVFSYTIINESLPDDLKLNIYRIIQEQTNNILKYSEAKNVNISISEKDNVINIVVEDDGKGFDVSCKRKGIGISNMINRIESYNGQIEIKSSEGNGCKIFVFIPV